ncbi:hypothetical protein [Pseudooceanicola aestuarii]|uniref:hypothetical protein n=1 Tax=Pseudooceanicola aestuarii TaxID=2697319 RepID=UPI0013D3C160
MTIFEYRVVPAPQRGKRARGAKGPEGRFAHAIETLMNEMAGDGWEYWRAETLPSEERSGLTSVATTYRNLLIFRRRRAGSTDAFRPELLEPPEREETPILLPAAEAAQDFRDPPEEDDEHGAQEVTASDGFAELLRRRAARLSGAWNDDSRGLRQDADAISDMPEDSAFPADQGDEAVEDETDSATGIDAARRSNATPEDAPVPPQDSTPEIPAGGPGRVIAAAFVPQDSAEATALNSAPDTGPSSALDVTTETPVTQVETAPAIGPDAASREPAPDATVVDAPRLVGRRLPENLRVVDRYAPMGGDTPDPAPASPPPPEAPVDTAPDAPSSGDFTPPADPDTEDEAEADLTEVPEALKFRDARP